MESQPQNPEFRINPENFHPCKCFSWPKRDFQNFSRQIYFSQEPFKFFSCLCKLSIMVNP